MKQWVYIKGALNTKLGDEGLYIARSSKFENHHLEEIDKKDKLLTSYFENTNTGNNAEQGILYASFNVYNGGQKELLIIRAQNKYTTFLDMGRAYHRREYYFFQDENNELNPVTCINSLPDMIQFGEYNMDYNPGLQLNKERSSIDPGFLSRLLQALLTNKDGRLVINIKSSTENEEVLRSINTLPAIYIQHIQIGLNFSASNPFENQMDVVTGSAMSNAGSVDAEFVKLAEDIINDTSWYDDREIKLQQEPDILQALARYHQLAYYQKKQQVPPAKIVDLQEYLRKFYKKEFIQNEKIQERIKRTWQLVAKEASQDESLFDFTWDITLGSGINIDKTEQYLPGFSDLTERLISKLALSAGSLQEIENKYARLNTIQLASNDEPVTSKIISHYIESRNLSVNDLKLLLVLAAKGRSINKKSIANKIDSSMIRSLGDDGLKVLDVFASELSLSTMEPLVKSIGSTAMFEYANSKTDFFDNKKLVTACDDFMHFKELTDAGIKQSLEWALLYTKKGKELRIGKSDAEKTLKQVVISDWNQFKVNTDLAKTILSTLDEESIIKTQLLANLNEPYLPVFLNDYVKTKESRLTIGEDIPYAKSFSEFRDNYNRIKTHASLFKQGNLGKYTRIFLEEYDFKKNTEVMIGFIKLVEPESYKILVEKKDPIKEILIDSELITQEVMSSSKFINTVIMGNTEEKPRKKKDNSIMRVITKYGVWVLLTGAIAGLIYFVIANGQQKMQLQDKELLIKYKTNEIDSLKVQRRPVEQIFIRLGKADTLTAYKLSNADSLIYLPASGK